jgi:flagellar basal-body rod protein FlgG
MAVNALHTAATGMQAMSTKIDVIANNIANADTPGFKAARVNFEDLFYQIRAQPGTVNGDNGGAPLGTQVGLGVAVSNTQAIFKQGSAIQTGNALDIMLEGDGFFEVVMPDGAPGYTRAGNLVRNAAGQLVLGNSLGLLLAGSPTIDPNIPEQRISISPNGEVSVTDGSTSTVVGNIKVVRFPNQAGLLNNGSNIFMISPASGDPIEATPGTQGIGTIRAGALEMSTTEAVSELVELIKAQRVFQMNSQTIQAADESLRTVANLRR